MRLCTWVLLVMVTGCAHRVNAEKLIEVDLNEPSTWPHAKLEVTLAFRNQTHSYTFTRDRLRDFARCNGTRVSISTLAPPIRYRLLDKTGRTIVNSPWPDSPFMIEFDAMLLPWGNDGRSQRHSLPRFREKESPISYRCHKR